MRRKLTLDSPCPICSAATEEFLRREEVPVHQNLLMAEPDAARRAARGTLALHVCQGCGFVFNAAFDPGLLSYGPAYDNTQTVSTAFNLHTSELVRALVEVHGVRGCRVVEVGSGKGGFLRQLVSYPDADNSGLGFDPSYTGPPTDLDGRVRFFRRMFDATAEVTADVIICRHVIEHVPDPVGLLRSIRGTLLGSPKARVFFETPCVEWILRHQVGWDFFYEHCSLFSAASLSGAFRAAGFTVTAIRHVFGGQYLWLEATPVEGAQVIDHCPEPVLGMARRFAVAESPRLRSWSLGLVQFGRAGPVAVWGAGAKGVTFCHLADPAGERVACVVDINPAKQGKFVAGTGHPILSPEGAVARGVAKVLVLNPNYVTEVTDCLARHGSAAEVLDLMRADSDRMTA